MNNLLYLCSLIVLLVFQKVLIEIEEYTFNLMELYNKRFINITKDEDWTYYENWDSDVENFGHMYKFL